MTNGYQTIYRPPVPHECWLPRNDGWQEHSVVRCIDCGRYWVLRNITALMVDGFDPLKAMAYSRSLAWFGSFGPPRA